MQLGVQSALNELDKSMPEQMQTSATTQRVLAAWNAGPYEGKKEIAGALELLRSAEELEYLENAPELNSKELNPSYRSAVLTRAAVELIRREQDRMLSRIASSYMKLFNGMKGVRRDGIWPLLPEIVGQLVVALFIRSMPYLKSEFSKSDFKRKIKQRLSYWFQGVESADIRLWLRQFIVHGAAHGMPSSSSSAANATGGGGGSGLTPPLAPPPPIGGGGGSAAASAHGSMHRIPSAVSSTGSLATRDGAESSRSLRTPGTRSMPLTSRHSEISARRDSLPAIHGPSGGSTPRGAGHPHPPPRHPQEKRHLVPGPPSSGGGGGTSATPRARRASVTGSALDRPASTLTGSTPSEMAFQPPSIAALQAVYENAKADIKYSFADVQAKAAAALSAAKESTQEMLGVGSSAPANSGPSSSLVASMLKSISKSVSRASTGFVSDLCTTHRHAEDQRPPKWHERGRQRSKRRLAHDTSMAFDLSAPCPLMQRFLSDNDGLKHAPPQTLTWTV